MPIETNCPGCNQRQRVADEHAGRQARCPSCSTVYTVPSASTIEKSSSAGPSFQPSQPQNTVAADAWRMRTPEGQTYGPISKTELDRWMNEGRVTAQCQLQYGANGAWQSADRVYPHLAAAASQGGGFSASGSSNPYSTNPYAGSYNPAGSAPSHAGSSSYQIPHRGPLILTMGILSWVLASVIPCPIFSIIAWVMGSTDLRQMREGRMDPSGKGLTQAGQILGIVFTVLWLIGAACIGLLFLAVIVAEA